MKEIWDLHGVTSYVMPKSDYAESTPECGRM